MSVNQLAFLMLVGISVVFYYLVPKRAQWIFLLLVSLVFYRLMGVHNFLYILLAAVVLTVGTGQMTGKPKKLRRRWLVGILVILLGLLAGLKYGDFLIENLNHGCTLLGLPTINQLGLAAPLGISYYTLQGIGYALEVYRGKAKPNKNPLKTLLFLTYYPQMTQGPIGRYMQLAPQLFAGHSFSFATLGRGCRRILWGLFKKAVVADQFRPLVNNIFDNYQSVSGLTLFMGCIYMAVQMYADFSGYTDLVWGISKLYGIELTENFKRPFFSKSLGEYWRRWHISLSFWFRDYVFYPASVSKRALRFARFGKKHISPRIGKICPVLYAMSIVWVCTGLWHDASWRYILWGVANGVVLISGVLFAPTLKRIKERLHIRENAPWWKGFCMMRTFLLVALLKVFPGADTTGQSFVFLKKIFCEFQPVFARSTFFLDTEPGTLCTIALGLCLMLMVSILEERGNSIGTLLVASPLAVRWLIYLAVLTMLIFLGNFDAAVTGGFEYAQF